MTTPAMLDNILAQPASHSAVLALHQGAGRANLRACAEKIRNGRGRVIVTGMGGSLFAAVPAVSHLQQHGYLAQAVESAELLHYGSAHLRAADLGIVISRSGESIEPVLLAEKMRQAGMTVIGVTNVPGSKLEQLAHLTLAIGAQADKLIAVQTYTGTVLTLLLLAEEALAGDNHQFSEACAAALPALSAHIDQCLRAGDSWQDLLTSGTLYLLGRGPALASVHEGALLLHETAKAAAVGMSSGQFRHGPAEVVSKDFRAVVFGTPLQTQILDRALADDLFSLGADVRWIGPSRDPGPDPGDVRHRAPSMVSWPVVPPLLAPLFEIVPLQVAAYRLALWRGITPGDFRYVSEVTSSESGFPASHG
jgi:glucosamine--fructose-6-phosphate aminotransferase (isomerizing)